MTLTTLKMTGATSNAPLVAGVVDRIILVTRIVLTSQAAGKFTLLSDPGGGALRELLPPLYVPTSGTLDLRLNRRYSLAADRGKGVGVSYETVSFNDKGNIAVWYVLVD